QAVDETERDRVHAQAERERGDRHDADDRRSPEDPAREARVPARIVDPAERSGVAMGLFDRVDGAEPPLGRGARLLRRQAPADEIVLEERAMGGEFATQLALAAPRQQPVKQPPPELPQAPDVHASGLSHVFHWRVKWNRAIGPRRRPPFTDISGS